MKKFIGLGIAVAVVVGLIASGTWAVFTDTETTTNNTFTAGTIDISVDPTAGQDVVTVDGTLDLKPCQVGWIKVNVINDGTNPAEIWKHIANVVNEENEIVDAEEKFYLSEPGSDQWLLSDWIHYDMCVCLPLELCLDETDFEHRFPDRLPYEFDVCRTIGDGTATWTIDFVEDTIPGWWASAVQLVISSDGVDPDFQIGVNSASSPMYGDYDGGWQPITDELPEGMSVVGNEGDSHFEITIPYDICDLFWAMSVEATFEGQSSTDQYMFPNADNFWGDTPFYHDCNSIIDEDDGFYLTVIGPHLPQGVTPEENEVECHWIYLGVLQPGESLRVAQSYHLDELVENWGQSDKVIFDMEFVAQQIEGTLPEPPGPVLPDHGRPE